MFALFYFVFKGKFQVQAPRGAYIRRGDLTEGFLHYDFGGLYLEGLTYMEGLNYFRNFTVMGMGFSEYTPVKSEFTQQDCRKESTASHLCVTNVTR